MKIKQLYETQNQVISFEFFPPKTDDAEEKLFKTVDELKGLKPSFVSVTYGAMGTTRANTLRIVTKIKKEIGIEAAAHLTCVAHNKAEIELILKELSENGVENVVALRGDRPKDQPEAQPIQNGFHHASELVRFIKHHAEHKDRFSLAVAGYPEGHPECRDKDEDLRHLRHKVDQGADLIVTQLFLNNDYYFRFVDRCRKIGIHVPIVPGVMPVTHGPQIQKFASMCGTSIPDQVNEAIAKYGDDQASVEAFGIEYATRQCEGLLENGAPGLHFYTLNKSAATRQIYSNLFPNGKKS